MLCLLLYLSFKNQPSFKKKRVLPVTVVVGVVVVVLFGVFYVYTVRI